MECADLSAPSKSGDELPHSQKKRRRQSLAVKLSPPSACSRLSRRLTTYIAVTFGSGQTLRLTRAFSKS